MVFIHVNGSISVNRRILVFYFGPIILQVEIRRQKNVNI